jgi:hypothetical protein
MRKLCRVPSERTDPSRNDYAPGKDRFTDFEGKPETVCIDFNADDFPSIKIRRSLTLVPKPIVDETVERYRRRKVIAACSSVCLQGQ